jgi:hypothetical protein
MKMMAMAAMAVVVAMDAGAQEADPILDVLDNPKVIDAMKTAWIQARCGNTNFEAAFRLDGSAADFRVVGAIPSHLFMEQEMPFIRGRTFAFFHVHPTQADPAPSQNDRALADKYRVKMFTIHRFGLYLYDPATRKTTLLRSGAKWMKPAANREIPKNIIR